jgi:hypothetical protein
MRRGVESGGNADPVKTMGLSVAAFISVVKIPSTKSIVS